MPLSDFLSHYLPLIEAEMRAVVGDGQTEPAEYHEMLLYHLGWTEHGQGPAVTGKHIRPVLTLLACAAAGGDPPLALPAAAAVELLHNFTLVHDDIQDDSPSRRGRPTVWKLWGRAQAINAGDALFTLAHLALQRLAPGIVAPAVALEAVDVLDQTCMALTRGQYLDMSFESRVSVSVAEYWEMIEGKTAALVAAAADLGALCADAPASQRQAFREFGRHVGLAFQAHDDVLGIWGDSGETGKSTATDIETRKKTLPVVFGLERSERLRQAYAATEHDGGALVTEIVAELEAVGARAHAEAEARRLSDVALGHLTQANPSPEAGAWLRELTGELLGRRR
jgi:geranylgeranyl diphosphate synthase type I